MRTHSTDPGGYHSTAEYGPRSMPGWNIVVDLTPPELIASRRLKVVRSLVLAAVAVVLIGCIGGYFVASNQSQQAADNLEQEQARTASLLSQQRSYSGITLLKSTLAQSQQQVADLMASDVNLDALLDEVWTALPDGMTITSINVSIPATVGAPADTAKSGVSVLDTSDALHVGTITLSGTGATLNDVPAYIDALTKIPGVFDAFPVSNAVTKDAADADQPAVGDSTAGSDSNGAGSTDGNSDSTDDATGKPAADSTAYSLQITLTDAVLSKRFNITGDK